MNDPDFNLLAALDPLPVSTEVITVSQMLSLAVEL